MQSIPRNPRPFPIRNLINSREQLTYFLHLLSRFRAQIALYSSVILIWGGVFVYFEVLGIKYSAELMGYCSSSQMLFR